MLKPVLIAVFLGVPLLAGCVPLLSDPVPQAARLSSEILTLRLSDGTVCRTTWTVAGGAGRLEHCGPGYDYAVRVVEDPNLLRQMFTGMTAALGAEGLVPPMAEVVITDAAGQQYVFVSPSED